MSNLDLSFEETMSNPTQALKSIGQTIGIINLQKQEKGKTEELDKFLGVIADELKGMEAPQGSWGPDPITKLWPGHLSRKFQGGKKKEKSQSKSERKEKGKEHADEVFGKYGHYMKMYGYE